MNPDRRLSPLRLTVVGLLAALALTSCVPPGASPRPSRPLIGTLQVAGPNVFLNDRPARDGMRVFHGDEVSTGDASSARINLNGGGFVELDENTDPIWRWLQEAGRCLIEFIVRFGQVYGETGSCALRMVSDEGSAYIETTFHLRVDDNRVHLAVLRGRITVLAPLRRTIDNRQQALIAGGRVQTRPLPPEQFRRLIQWRDRYDFKTTKGVPRRPPGPSRLVTVPNVRRRHLEEARAILAKEGLEVGQIRRDVTSNAPVGTVVDQSPTHDQRVRRGTAVDLIVSDRIR